MKELINRILEEIGLESIKGNESEDGPGHENSKDLAESEDFMRDQVSTK